MQNVDRSAPAREAASTWGYWIPEPALLVGPADRSRQVRYLTNWVRALPVWLYVLRVPGGRPLRVSTQAWRQFLNGLPDNPKTVTRTGKRSFDIKLIFGDVFSEDQYDGEGRDEITWHGRRFTEVSEEVGTLVLWEAFELGFRYELLGMDRYLCPLHSRPEEARREEFLGQMFPSQSLYTVPGLPSRDSFGLFALLPRRRLNSLNALREVLVRWPSCPRSIVDAPPLQGSMSDGDIEAREYLLAQFYCSAFFELAGRAPIVPHYVPPP